MGRITIVKMESKLIIFLVFASLAHGSYVPSLSDNFGLSDADAVVLNQIVFNQDATTKAYASGLEFLFNTIFDLDVEADADYSTINAALIKVKESIDIHFDSDLLALGEPCSAVEVARNVSNTYIEDTFRVQIYGALRLARSGNYPTSRGQIETYQAAAQENVKNIVESDYNSFITCLSTTNADKLAKTEEARSGALTSHKQLVNAIFNAIKTLASASGAKRGDATFTDNIEEHWTQALNRINSNVEYKFSLLRTVYITSRVNGENMLAALATNQYGLSVAFNKYKKSYEVMYSMLLYFLRRADLGIEDEGLEIFSRHDAAVAEVNVRFASSGTLTLDAIPLINPAFAELLAILREQLEDMSYEGDEAFLDVIDGVIAYQGNDWAEIMEIIDHYREIAIAVYEPSNVMIFQFIRNDLTWSDEVDAKLLALQAKANKSASDASHRFFDGVEIMARARYEGKASADDWAAMEALIVESYAEVDILLQSLFAAGFYVLQEHSAQL